MRIEKLSQPAGGTNDERIDILEDGLIRASRCGVKRQVERREDNECHVYGAAEM